MTNHPEDALRALEQKMLSASCIASRCGSHNVSVQYVDEWQRELSAILRQTEAAPSPPDSSPKECCGNYNYNGDCCGRYVTTTNSPAIDTSLVVGPADSSQGGPIQNLCGWEFDDAAGVHHVTNSLELPSYAQSNIKPRYTHPSSPQVAVAEFQSRVRDWTHSCFGAAIANDKTERNHRFLEESLEQVQSLGCTQSEAHQLVDYVYGRPSGDPMQEAGGVMVTFAALCNANDISMREVGEAELARIWTKLETIRAKQAAKPKHSPLPQADDEPLFTASMYGTAAAADKAREEWLAAKGEPQDFQEAWYEVASLLGISAQNASPKDVHEKQVMPRLRTLLGMMNGETVAFIRWGEFEPRLEWNQKFDIWADSLLDARGLRQDFTLAIVGALPCTVSTTLAQAEQAAKGEG
jgi:hypothetical protein